MDWVFFKSVLKNVSIRWSRVSLSSVVFNSVRVSSIEFKSIQFNSVQFSSVQFMSVRFNGLFIFQISFAKCIDSSESRI